jgi:hypothetical protein
VLWSATGTLHSEAETPGPRMYGPIDHLPFIVFHYPPAYHLASRAVMALGVDPLAAWRMVSLAATAVISISIAWLVAAGLAGRVGPSAVLVGAVHPTLGRAAASHSRSRCPARPPLILARYLSVISYTTRQ